MGWTGHVADMEETRNEHNILAEMSEEKRPLGSLVVDGVIVLKWL